MKCLSLLRSCTPFVLLATLACAQTPRPVQTARPPAGTFTNPITPDGADPWIVYQNGFYYMTRTVGWGVAIRKSPTLTGLRTAKDNPVWRGGGPGWEMYTRDVWAPEIHFLRGKWYAYFTATDGPDANRRVFALESKTADPLGAYTFKGEVSVPGDDDYAIDGTIYERKDGALFFLWSGREAATKSAQNIYIAPMSNPWTIRGPRVRLSTPTFDWEKHGWLVNEGPEVLAHGSKTFVVYSASGGTTPDYCLGLLSNTNGDLLNPAAWTKAAAPVFARYEGQDGHVYTPGHNGFFRSPDGKEDWIVYHGKENEDNTWGGRSARAQRLRWKPDGTPDFAHPIPAGIPIPVPGGEQLHTTFPALQSR